MEGKNNDRIDAPEKTVSGPCKCPCHDFYDNSSPWFCMRCRASHTKRDKIYAPETLPGARRKPTVS